MSYRNEPPFPVEHQRLAKDLIVRAVRNWILRAIEALPPVQNAKR